MSVRVSWRKESDSYIKEHACERDGRERSEHKRDSNICIRDDDTCNPYSNQNSSMKHAYSYEFTHIYVI